MIFRSLAIATAIIGAGIAFPMQANAYPGRTEGRVNMRTAPTVHSHRIMTLRPGARVDIRDCRGSWCRVFYHGRAGWVASSYLNRGPSYRHYRPAPWARYGWRHDRHGWHHHRHHDRNGVYFRSPGFGLYLGR